MTKSRKFQEWRTYHVTHRCHNRDFLLKTDLDRREYIRLMWEAHKRWDLSVLSYIVTSNHVHMLLASRKLEEMGGFMGQVSGGMSRFYNRRKGRLGSFWEGRYRATLIQDGAHLSRCLFYIAMNMVRAGVVRHPREWDWSSHHELCGGRQRYRLLDIDRLLNKLMIPSEEEFLTWYEKTIADILTRRRNLRREPWWSSSSIVGDLDFVSGFVENRRRDDIVSLDNETFYI